MTADLSAASRLRRMAFLLSHPLASLPIAVPIGLWFSRYSPADVTELQRVPLFLQGSTDWGGAVTYSATLALYVTFGLLASVHLTLRLDALRPGHGALGKTLLAMLWLAPLWILFLYASTQTLWYDTRVVANDFRNAFVLAATLFTLSTFWIVWLSGRPISLRARVLLAPLLIYAWLGIGSDGTTAKAGQVVNVGEDPLVESRGQRHGIMLAWHELCDTALGDIEAPP